MDDRNIERDSRPRAKSHKMRNLNLMILLTLIVLEWILYTISSFNYFNSGTIINGVNVSWLTPEVAAERLDEHLKGDVYVTVPSLGDDGNFSHNTYVATTEDFGLKVGNYDALNQILTAQKSGLSALDIFLIFPIRLSEMFFPKEGEEITVNGLASVDVNLVDGLLKMLSELKAENMSRAENAYIALVGNFLEIQPEKNGNYADYNEVLNYVISSLESGNYNIDISPMMEERAEITHDDERLVANVEKINGYLSSSSYYQLADGSEVALTAETMKNWLEVSNDGTVSLNIRDNLPEFLDVLEEKVNETTSYITLAVGEGKWEQVVLEEKWRPKFDRQAEYERIERYILVTGGVHYNLPSYKNTKYLIGNPQTYIALSIDKQKVWAYKDGEMILEASCVTGCENKGYSTPTGIYYLRSKERDTYLKGKNLDGSEYNSFVNFWMPFNGGIGFHDASWRSKFGGTIYIKNGSHGCVNMKYKDAQKLYDFIDKTIPIIVY